MSTIQRQQIFGKMTCFFGTLVISLGFGGNGITFSLIAAEIITDLVLERENGEAKIFALKAFEKLAK